MTDLTKIIQQLLESADLKRGEINNVPISTAYALENRSLITSDWHKGGSQTTSGGLSETSPSQANAFRCAQARELNGTGVGLIARTPNLLCSTAAGSCDSARNGGTPFWPLSIQIIRIGDCRRFHLTSEEELAGQSTLLVNQQRKRADHQDLDVARRR